MAILICSVFWETFMVVYVDRLTVCLQIYNCHIPHSTLTGEGHRLGELVHNIDAELVNSDITTHAYNPPLNLCILQRQL